MGEERMTPEEMASVIFGELRRDVIGMINRAREDAVQEERERQLLVRAEAEPMAFEFGVIEGVRKVLTFLRSSEAWDVAYDYQALPHIALADAIQERFMPKEEK